MEHEPIFCNKCARCCNDDYEIIQGDKGKIWHTLCGSCYKCYNDEDRKILFDEQTKKLNRLTTS